MTEPKIIGRKFLGKTEDFNDKAERAHEQRHLKAYLKGKSEFTHGRIRTKQGVVPKSFKVKQQYIYE
jgi:hypothetical protein